MQLRDDRIHGAEIRVAYTYVQQPGARPALVQVAETLDKRAQLANEIIKGVILPQFVILPLAVILVWFGLTRGLAPLNAIQERIRARSPGDTSPIDEGAAPQELTPLVASFNELLGRLEQSVQTQKRFIADAAHQMKTPLAGLRMQAELAQREQSPDELRRTLAHIADSSERTAHLVKQLLSLARMENMGAADGMVPLDLCALSRQVVAEWLPKAWAKQIDLGFEEPGAPVTTSGNATMLAEMLNNLLDNAIRYTPDGGHVTVRVTTAPFEPFVFLDVEDTGPGIPAGERERVMQRFYRILGTQAEGSGLGLAIVREIVQQHGGDIAVLDYVYQSSPRLAGRGSASPCRAARRARGPRRDARRRIGRTDARAPALDLQHALDRRVAGRVVRGDLRGGVLRARPVDAHLRLALRLLGGRPGCAHRLRADHHAVCLAHQPARRCCGARRRRSAAGRARDLTAPSI